MKDVILKAGEIKRQNIPFSLDGKEFYAFVERLTNKRYADAIAVRQIRSESGMDEYRLFDLIQSTNSISTMTIWIPRLHPIPNRNSRAGSVRTTSWSPE